MCSIIIKLLCNKKLERERERERTIVAIEFYFKLNFKRRTDKRKKNKM